MTTQLDQTIELPEPWYWTDQDLSRQLDIEISIDHTLKNKSVKTIARRQDKDDVLFQISDGKYAVVHLTWQQYPHSDKRWPTTVIFNTWDDVYQNRILSDAADFK